MSASLVTIPIDAIRTRLGKTVDPRVGTLGVVSIIIICVLVVIAILAPFIAPYDPTASNLLLTFQDPSLAHLLGTDNNGRDLLSRLIFGSRTSLAGPLAIIISSTVVATTLALIAAWFGGIVDTIISRSMDICFAFPGILLAILATAIFGAGIIPAIVALSISYVPYLGRIIRSAAIRERALPYVESLFIGGVSATAISCWHITKNIAPVIVAQATVSFGYALVDLAALSFLGLGVQRPTADWGLMVASGEEGLILGHPAESLYAGALLVLAVAAFNILGERLVARYGAQTV